MGDVLRFVRRRRRARVSAESADQRSGRKSLRDTPVVSSIAKTNSAGTPFLERVSQYQTCDCEVPMRSASGFCPPAISQARRSASDDISPSYLNLGGNQPKSLSATEKRNFGKTRPMLAVDKQAFAARVRARREKLGMSQTALANQTGMKQQSIANIENGIVERPRRMLELAEALYTTSEWLLWGKGPEEVQIVDAKEQIISLLQEVEASELAPVIQLLKTLGKKRPRAA